MNDHLVSPEDLRESLWEAYVYSWLNTKPTTDAERYQAALDVIAMFREYHALAEKESDDTKMMFAISRANAAFQLLAADVIRWTVSCPKLPDFFATDSWQGKEENALFDYLVDTQDNLPTSHKNAVDPVTMILPRWLYQRLVNALDALKVGDVHDFVSPEPGGKHSAPWGWYQFRVRALQHVAYLNGKGVGKMKAREQVAQAMKISPKTLREWEGECKEVVEGVEKHLAWAHEAGRFAVKRELDPGYAKNDGNSVDTEVLHVYKEMAIENLAAFGKKYRERYGNRHHTPDSAVK